jgi:protein-disulfide isomerase
MAKRRQSNRRGGVKAPRPPVPATGRRRHASRRVRVGAAAILVLIVVGIVLGLAFDGGASPTSVPARGSLTNGLPGATSAQQLFQGIPQHGNVLGSTTAPATLVEYVDLQCPYCQQFETLALPTLIKGYVRTGKVKIELRPIAFIGPDSASGRLALIAAGQQNKLFDFAELLYLNQGAENSGWLNSSMISSAAASIPGVDVPQLLEQQSSTATQKEATSFDRQAIRDKISATPTLLAGKSGQTLLPVALASPGDAQSVAAALDNALSAK